MVLRRRAFFLASFAIFICAFAIRDSEGNRKTLQALNGGEDGVVAEHFGDNTVDPAWIQCKLALDTHNTNPELHLPSQEVKPLYKKRQLCGCLRTKNCAFWFRNTAQRYSSWPKSRRRDLITTISQSVSRFRHPSEYFSESIITESITDSLAPAPSQNVWAPAEAPEDPFQQQDLLDLAPKPSPRNGPPPPEIFLPLDMFRSSPPPHHPPMPPKTDDQMRKIASFVTVVATCLVVSMVLVCCVKSRRRSGHGIKDERPLLTLSLSDFSAGSSRLQCNSSGLSSNRDFNERNHNFVTNLSMKLGNREPSESTMTTSLPSLKTPPGSTAPAPAGVSPSPPPGHAPPPPPKAVRPPPAPPKGLPGKGPPNIPKPHRKSHSEGQGDESGSQKAKLKPFFWEKTVLTNTDQSMVWNEIRSGSFQFNEEMIETLFGYNNVDKNRNDRRKDSSSEAIQYIQIIESKKAQNLSILLRALNVTTEEVVDALREGNELPVDLLQTLLKVAPTAEEELKLRLYSGDLSQLGPAERFLKVLVDIPFAFKRLESLLVMCSFQEEASNARESLQTLEVASNKLRSSRLFLKLLEAVLKTGNRMNDGTYRGGAQAFRLDTLLKLADVKGTDNKTTLLHFVVKEIIRSEGVRAHRTARASVSSTGLDDFSEESPKGDFSWEDHHMLGLEVVLGLSDELEDVRKAAAVDADGLASTVARLGHLLNKTRDFLTSEMSNVDEDSEFNRTLTGFVKKAESDAADLLEEEKRVKILVKSTTDYFHGGSAGKDEGLRLFVIVRDFLIMVERVCREVKVAESKPVKNSNSRRDSPKVHTSSESLQSLSNVRQKLFPAIAGRRVEDSSSDDESSSP